MHISSLTLQNFKCFENFQTDLDPQCTVFIGDNGSGKTALLEGLSVALGTWFLGFDNAPRRAISMDEVRLRMVEHSGALNAEPQYPVSVSAMGRVDPDSPDMQWTRKLNQAKGNTTYGEARALRDVAASYQQAIRAGQPLTLPIIAYYSTSRLWIQRRKRPQQLAIPSRLQGYIDCLESISNHKLFTAWMQRHTLIHLQSLQAHGVLGAQPEMTPMRVIRQCVSKLVEGAQEIFFDYKHSALVIRFNNNQILPFNLLSDGYRNLISMLSDVAWRALQLNPHLINNIADTPGVVLIDEIDLHLHPKWQRDVLGKITAVFPKIQWVVTTHSPQVIASAKREWVRALSPQISEPSPTDTAPSAHIIAAPPGYTQGRDTNAILTDIMGTTERPQPEAEQLRTLFDLIERQAHQPARDLIACLQEKLGPHDTALVRALWMLHMDSDPVDSDPDLSGGE